MNSGIEVSVLMSVWNGMPYVPLTVASVLAQTYRDFEFVIVDNFSTDGTRDFLEKIAATDSRIKLVFNQQNLGHSGGLNRGIEECKGRWIARIDADDLALPERLERQLAFLRENPDVKLASSLAYYIDASGRRVGKTEHPMKTREIFEKYKRDNEAIGLFHPSVIMDCALVRSLGGYREPFGAANDIDLWARIAETGVTILVQQERLIEYRVHPAAISANFMGSRIKYEWARACMIARRKRVTEPNWEAFTAEWKSAPILTKLNRFRKAYAKANYRQSALNYICGKRLRAFFQFGCASLLQPTYTLRRLFQQRLP
jgi:glycosyltransferase involved in cell wall biosynthesis